MQIGVGREDEIHSFFYCSVEVIESKHVGIVFILVIPNHKKCPCPRVVCRVLSLKCFYNGMPHYTAPDETLT